MKGRVSEVDGGRVGDGMALLTSQKVCQSGERCH